MAVQIFRSTDTGAPTFNNTAGSFIAVLDFCLLGLGWTKVVLGANQAAYTQPAGSNGFVLQVDDSSASQSKLNGYQALSSLNVGVGNFNPAGTPAPAGYCNLNHGATSAAAPWRLITNGKIFHFSVQWQPGGTPPYTDFVSFGDINSYVPGDAYATVLLGYTSWSAPYGWIGTNLNSSWSASTGTAAVARSWNQVSLGTLPTIITDSALLNSSASAGANAPNYPDPVSGQLNLAPFWLAETPSTYYRGGVRGLIPGVWCIAGKTSSAAPAPFNDGDTFTAGSGVIAGRTFEIVGVNGSPYGQVAIETSNTWGGF
jgi:hypothetical protein